MLRGSLCCFLLCNHDLSSEEDMQNQVGTCVAISGDLGHLVSQSFQHSVSIRLVCTWKEVQVDCFVVESNVLTCVHGFLLIVISHFICWQQSLGEDVMTLLRPYLSRPNPPVPITRWPFFLFLLGAMTCMLTSSVCHLLGCQSKEVNSLVWRFDYAGIAALVATSFYPPVYYGFLCDPLPRVIYLTTITVIGFGAILVSLLDKFQQTQYRIFRACLFLGMGLCGVVPTAHKVLFYWMEPVVVTTTLLEILMGVLYGLGAMFYASRIPERWLPGKFDIAGHSHQIFHILVIAGALTHYQSGMLYLEWRDREGCSGFA